MQPELAKRLWDAAESARRIQEFTKGMSYLDFASSKLVRSAVERQFEIIGEALNKASILDSDLSYQMPEVPRIVGLRNRLIHGYDSVDDQLVWDIVISKIPGLLESLEKRLEY